jgi:hypothetical protein
MPSSELGITVACFISLENESRSPYQSRANAFTLRMSTCGLWILDSQRPQANLHSLCRLPFGLIFAQPIARTAADYFSCSLVLLSWLCAISFSSSSLDAALNIRLRFSYSSFTKSGGLLWPARCVALLRMPHGWMASLAFNQSLDILRSCVVVVIG